MEEKAASVVAEEPCRTLVMTPAARNWLEANRQDLVLRLYGFLLDSQFHAEPDAGTG